jgi:hypothetical protein
MDCQRIGEGFSGKDRIVEKRDREPEVPAAERDRPIACKDSIGRGNGVTPAIDQTPYQAHSLSFSID